MRFGTVVNCTDGRVQYPVMDYLKKHYDFDFFDSANEAGPLRTLTKNSDKWRSIPDWSQRIRIKEQML